MTHFFIKWQHQNSFKSSFRKAQNALSSLTSTQLTEYIKNRFIGEGGRLIFDKVDIYDCNNIGVYLAKMDIEKAFDSLDHKFILVE